MSLAGGSLEELGKAEKKEEFTVSKHQWFPRHDTPENASYDKRKPGNEMGLWVSIVNLNAVGVRRATKPTAKALTRNRTIPRKRFV